MSPIRPDQRALYPSDWRAISERIKARAGNRCECAGECGLHRTTPGPRRCTEVHGDPAHFARGTVVLTVAHLNHDPTDNRPENLRAMCQRCHNRYDKPHRTANAAATRHKKRTAGIESLFTEGR